MYIINFINNYNYLNNMNIYIICKFCINNIIYYNTINECIQSLGFGIINQSYMQMNLHNLYHIYVYLI